MVNGKQATQFNAEHTQLTNSIMASEEVLQMDKDMLVQIEEGLKTYQYKKQKRTRARKQPIWVTVRSQGAP